MIGIVRTRCGAPTLLSSWQADPALRGQRRPAHAGRHFPETSTYRWSPSSSAIRGCRRTTWRAASSPSTNAGSPPASTTSSTSKSQSIPNYGIIKIYFQPTVNHQRRLAQVTAMSQTVLKQLPAGIHATDQS